MARAVQAAKEAGEAASEEDRPFTREEFDRLLAENKTLKAEKAELLAQPSLSKVVSGGKGVPAVGLGDELQALPTEKYEGFFEPNDKGRVSSEPYIGDDGKQRFKVTWYRTGKTSVRVADTWPKGFKIVGKAGQPTFGDELQTLPLEKFEGYFEPGDKGRVSSEPFVDEKDDKIKFKVTWYRTGKTSQRVADGWMSGFRIVAPARRPEKGDVLQALPLENFDGYFAPGDQGKVSSDHFIDSSDGKLKFKVTWLKSGKTSTRVAEGWMRGFRFVEDDDHEHVNDELKKEMETAVADTDRQPAGKPIELISGQPKSAAMGLFHFMRVNDPFAEDSAHKIEKEITQFVQKLKEYAMILGYYNDVPQQREHIERIYGKDSVAEAKDEIEYFKKVARMPDDTTALGVAEKVEEESLGYLKYILYEKASEVFVPGPDGIRDKGRGPVAIQDFMKNKTVNEAELTLAHVVALRFYTTPGYKYLNSPFRNQDRYYHKNKPHPMPITMAYISEGIKKLRSAYAIKVEEGKASTHMTLWRGLRNMYMPDDFLKNRKGGTELAPMSTTTDIQVAARYACSDESVLLKISLDNFMQYGAELGWLSAFPGEVEVLYPPLTYLQPTGKEPQVVQLSTGHKFTVHEVSPTIP
jgi:hypothetical protein